MWSEDSRTLKHRYTVAFRQSLRLKFESINLPGESTSIFVTSDLCPALELFSFHVWQWPRWHGAHFHNFQNVHWFACWGPGGRTMMWGVWWFSGCVLGGVCYVGMAAENVRGLGGSSVAWWVLGGC